MSRKAAAVALALLLVPSLALAADSSWKLRARVIAVQPNESSDVVPGTGSEVAVDSSVVPEVDLTYMVHERWGLELVAAYAGHDLSGEGGLLNGVDLGSANLLPPTLTLQYFFAGGERVKPYVGAGINFTTFSYDLPDDGNPSDDVRGLGVDDVDLDSSFGFAAGGGLDFPFGESWLFNVDVKYVTISTDATLKSGGTPVAEVGVDVDPWIFGVGIGYRF